MYCDGCRIKAGGLESHLVEFRGKGICSFCRNRWNKIEEKVGREINFEEFGGKELITEEVLK